MRLLGAIGKASILMAALIFILTTSILAAVPLVAIAVHVGPWGALLAVFVGLVCLMYLTGEKQAHRIGDGDCE